MKEFEHSTLTAPDLYDQELEKLIEPFTKEVIYSSQTTFSRPGEKIDCIFYIKKGMTRHYMDSEDGMIKMLYALTPGWFFGETPYFMKSPTGLYSQAIKGTVLYRLPGEHCDYLMKKSDLFREKIICCFAHKMLILRYEIANLSFYSCKERLKRLFCTSIDENKESSPDWYDLKIRYTQQELGEIVGGSRVTVSRQINELCREGFIRILNRSIQVSKKEYSAFMGQRIEHELKDDQF